MKNTILVITAFIILLSIGARADTNVSVAVSTTENINFYGLLDTSGNISVVIDGVGFPEYVDESILEYAQNNKHPNLYVSEAYALKDKLLFMMGYDGTQTEDCPACIQSANLLEKYVWLRFNQYSYPLYLKQLALERAYAKNKSLDWGLRSVASEFDAWETLGIEKPDIMKGVIVINVDEQKRLLAEQKAIQDAKDNERKAYEERLDKKKQKDLLKFTALCDTTHFERYCLIAKNLNETHQ
jgi:hypothetical protein